MLISMNLGSERKHNMKSLLTVISLALAFESPAFAGIEWGFDSGANPLDVGGPGVSGRATITVGSFGTGWHLGTGTDYPWSLSYPGASGYWDLGQAGSIVLSGLSGSGLTTLTVFQWVDSGTYGGTLNFAVNGGPSGTLAPLREIAASGTSGAWWEYVANLGSLNPAQIMVSAPGGAIIDRLTLVPEPATMIAGAILLIPFVLSTWPILHRRRTT